MLSLPKSNNFMNKQELRAAISIGLLYVIRMLGLFMILPVLPAVGADLALATPLLIGLALGVYGLSQAVLQIPMGLLSDKFGRKPVILAGLLMFIFGSLVAANADTIIGVIVGRLLQGCGAIASALLALLSDVTRVDQRSKAMAIVGISIGLSFAVALVAGPLVFVQAGLSGIFYFAAISGVLGIVVLFTLIPDAKVAVRNPEIGLRPERLLEITASPDLRRMVLGVFMLHYLLMSGFLVFPALLAGTGEIQTSDHSLVYFGLLLTTFVLMGPFMWLSDKPALTKAMLLLMIGGFAVSMLLFVNVVNLYPVLISMAIFFMAFNLLEVILPALVSRSAPAGARGTAMGIYSTGQFAGAFAGGALGGLLLSTGDMTYLLYVNTALCMGWLLISLKLKKTGNLGSQVFHLDHLAQLSAKEVADTLLSVKGVMDVVLLEGEKVAYLKINKDQLDTNALMQLEREGLATAR
jgi:MFS family permease|tara:strand:- start:4903 stop:6300 length:1398 start_codon:yes stop_codon:yes gene_type:complete